VSADVTAAGGQLAPGPAEGGGVIHNIGYRRYDGARLGRRRIVLALTWHSYRTAFGLGRGGRAKVFPALLLALLCLPAAVNAVALATSHGQTTLVSYDGYIPALRTVTMLIFVALEAPNLVSSDLRNHTLPLYFARPIHRVDYPVAKLTGFFLACLTMIEIPELLLYIGNVSQAHGAGQAWEQTLRLASVTGRRVFAICSVGVPLFFSYILAHALAHAGQQAFGPVAPGEPSALTSLAGLISPFTLLGGVLRWLQASRGVRVPAQMLQATTVGHYGPVYGVVFAALTIAAIGGLIVRYRRVGVA
jgi:ABC-2 type transport system permease protein